MKVFIAGASGVIGTRLIPLLINEGHSVVGMTRSKAKMDMLHSLGAIPVLCDVFDTIMLSDTIQNARPDILIHELTDLPDRTAQLDEFMSRNDRIRRIGTANLLKAAEGIPLKSFLVQSVAWELPGDSGKAVLEMEKMVLNAWGIVMRYGRLYGKGTYATNYLPEPPRVNIEEAVRRTVQLLTHPSGIVTITDD